MKAFRITLTAIYKDDDVTADRIYEDAWSVLEGGKDGNVPALGRVQSVKEIEDVGSEIAKIKKEVISGDGNKPEGKKSGGGRGRKKTKEPAGKESGKKDK